ncbi:MAG: acyl--CoA ligase [Gemmatimonadaceae bacterium]|nr:acyl--CoA ligase [Gemmatimonadaceae bacterium]
MSPGYGDPIRWWRRFSPERIALVDRNADDRLTYADLDRRSDRWLDVLDRQIGIRRGDRLALLMGNRREFAELFFACVRLGVALVPLNWRLSAKELGVILADATPALVIGEGTFRALAEEAERAAGVSLRWLDVEDDAIGMLEGAPSGFTSPCARVDGEDAAMVIYTSGSTGRPKGAVLPHRQLLYNAIATTIAWELGSSDVAPITTPFFHTGGWHVFATPLWLRGGSVVVMDQFDTATFLGELADAKCTVALTVPTQLMMLAESPDWGRKIPSLRWLISGGAPCPPPLAAKVRSAGYELREGYGLTECGPNCFAISGKEAAERPGSVGRPVPFLEMRLAETREAEAGALRGAETGRTGAGDGQPGELLLRGPQVFSGYLNAPELTAEVMTRDGWLKTGDLAVQDESGSYRICGRRKEMFISGGENVFPGEVEAALTDCPGVAEVVVVGVADSLWGEVGRAFVVPRRDATVSNEEVLAHARARLGRYKVPKSVVVLTDMPRLGSGKPDRRALAEMR